MTEAQIKLHLVTDLGENFLSTWNNPTILTAYTGGDSNEIWIPSHVGIDIDSHSQNKKVLVFFGPLKG